MQINFDLKTKRSIPIGGTSSSIFLVDSYPLSKNNWANYLLASYFFYSSCDKKLVFKVSDILKWKYKVYRVALLNDKSYFLIYGEAAADIIGLIAVDFGSVVDFNFDWFYIVGVMLLYRVLVNVWNYIALFWYIEPFRPGYPIPFLLTISYLDMLLCLSLKIEELSFTINLWSENMDELSLSIVPFYNLFTLVMVFTRTF